MMGHLYLFPRTRARSSPRRMKSAPQFAGVECIRGTWGLYGDG